MLFLSNKKLDVQHEAMKWQLCAPTNSYLHDCQTRVAGRPRGYV